MAEVAAGSSEALATVYVRLGPSVRAVGRRIVGDAGADDVVQETFERVWRHAARFDRRRGSLDAWTLTPAVWWVHVPITSPPPSAFPQSSWGRLPAPIRSATSEREVISGRYRE